MYEIFRSTDGLYIANSGQLVLKVLLNDLFMAEKLCNLLNSAEQSVQADGEDLLYCICPMPDMNVLEMCLKCGLPRR